MSGQVYQPKRGRDHLRRERVEFPDGSYLWVWELGVAEMLQTTEQAERSPNDPRGGIDTAAVILHQVICSCYDSDDVDAKRIFSALDPGAVAGMRMEEYELVMAAIQRVNGKDATTEEITRDFFAAGREASISA